MQIWRTSLCRNTMGPVGRPIRTHWLHCFIQPRLPGPLRFLISFQQLILTRIRFTASAMEQVEEVQAASTAKVTPGHILRSLFKSEWPQKEFTFKKCLIFPWSSVGSSGSNCSWSRTEGKTAAGDFRLGGVSEMGDAHDFDFRRERAPSERSAAPPSEGSVRSSRSHTYSLKQGSARGAPGSPSGRHLASIPTELTGSRRSCNTANGEFFVDIMWLCGTVSSRSAQTVLPYGLREPWPTRTTS